MMRTRVPLVRTVLCTGSVIHVLSSRRPMNSVGNKGCPWCENRSRELSESSNDVMLSFLPTSTFETELQRKNELDNFSKNYTNSLFTA
ncbi:hypothetical protein DPMN_064480 [Dreissena polymorpha]|uniref:Uncharacterized protein n=1 Tax=Dreissena polymorpha TaxID=45954 RepID=A0A9D4HM68_DREPO|nr:hypothetical protein DPMN_064480 [Dreissena polymorpha]